jgi:hypothetical protein
MDWISILIIFILEESVVSLAVSSCHLNSSHSCTISHIANHTRINKAHQVLRVMDSFIVKVVKLLLIVTVLRHMKFRMKHYFKKVMLVAFNDVVKRGVLNIWAPVGCHLRNLIFSGDTSLKQFFIACDCSSNDVSIVTSNTAINEEVVLYVFLVDILVD